MHRSDSCETVRSASEIYSVINSVYSFDSVWQESHCESISASRLHVCIMTSGQTEMETRILTSPRFDERFLQSLAAGNEDAVNYLIGHFSRPVRLSLRARLRSPELIKDAYQETFLRVLAYFRSGKMLDDPGNLPAFVHIMCRNVALELLRRDTRHDQLSGNAPEPLDNALNLEGQILIEERREIVRKLLKDLPAKDRELLRRVFLEEEDKDSVCAEFQIDRAYLRVLLHRARLRFKVILLQWSLGKGARLVAGIRSARSIPEMRLIHRAPIA